MKLKIMTLIMDINKANNEISWVIKMIETVRTKEQLEVVLKCFLLWDMKHESINKQNPLKSSLKSKFWAVYKTKETEFSYPVSI